MDNRKPKTSGEAACDLLIAICATGTVAWLLAALWFCIDDWIAEAFGVPAIGTVPPWVIGTGLILARQTFRFLTRSLYEES